MFKSMTTDGPGNGAGYAAAGNGHGNASGQNAHGPEKDPLKHYLHLKDKAKRITDTTDLEHRRAYNKAAEELLKDSEGLIDYSKLKDRDIQIKFADTMSEHYIAKAREALKVDPKHKGDELYNDMIMRAYVGVTKGELKQNTVQYGQNFTFETFNERIRVPYMRQIQQTLHAAAGSHLKDQHLEDIIKHIGAENLIDKEKIRLQEAIGLFDAYEDGNRRVDKLVEGQVYAKKKAPEPAQAHAPAGAHQ